MLSRWELEPRPRTLYGVPAVARARHAQPVVRQPSRVLLALVVAAVVPSQSSPRGSPSGLLVVVRCVAPREEEAPTAAGASTLDRLHGDAAAAAAVA